MALQEDEICYERFLSGDKDALETLVSLHRHGLTLYLYEIVRDMGLAEDLMIDTFAQLVLSGSRYRRKASLKTYLFTIGRNLALHQLREQRGTEPLPPEEASALPDVVQETVLARDERRELYDAMRHMSGEYRETLDLLYFEGMSYDEAGQVLGKSRKQIANLAYRAKSQLRGILTEGGFANADR